MNNYVLRLSGKAELPEDIEIGHNYHVSLEGSVPTFQQTDNEDGTFTRTYTFKPVKIDLLNAKGETLKLKDTRSQSQLLRARFWKQWQNMPDDIPFEEWYPRLMNNLIQHAPEIAEMYYK